uniref:Uncharacterized protein n=1 Tax=Cynoglossus semilaevis TaxID=244447 RepID=A0A3P8VYQ3_CYNSE
MNKPILLRGHERSISQIKYNGEGDLLEAMIALKPFNIYLQHCSPTGGQCVVRLGTYNGHMGAVPTCGFDFSCNIIMFSTDKQMGCQCFMNLFDLRDPQIDARLPEYSSFVELVIMRNILLLFICCQYSGEVLKKAKEHSRHINDIQTSVDLTMFISVSKDNTAKVRTLMLLIDVITVLCDAAISPIMDHEAMEVTTASTRIGKFEARFFQAVYDEEFGRSQRSFWSHQLCGFPL